MIRRLFRLFLCCLVFFSLVVIFLYAPLDRYRPACNRGKWEEIEFVGPMRDAYVGQLAEVLERDGFPYFRVGNEIFFRFAESLYPITPFSAESPHDILINWEWRIAYNIATGYGPGDSRIEPPAILLELEKMQQEHLKQKYPHLESEWSKSHAFYRSCELIRAAAIRIEDMPPGSLPHLADTLPHSLELPPQYRRPLP